jgi:hypothetical protein
MNKEERAKNLLIDEFFQELLKAQKDSFKSYIFSSAEHDVEGRERALVKLKALEEFEASIQSIANNGEIEKKRIKVF